VIDYIAAIGDVSDPRCWSGTPYHFWRAAVSQGWKASPIAIPLERAAWRRRRWNAMQLVSGRGLGGYQYSESFADWAWQFLGEVSAGSRVLTFHPFTPSLGRLVRAGGELTLYTDATHPLLFARYGLGKSLPRRMERHILDTERRVFEAATRLVFFQRWAAESAVRDCGADPAKVFVILPGANLELPPAFRFEAGTGTPGVERPFYFGFVAKDWRRKGFTKLLATAEALDRMGLKVVLRCIGLVPAGAESHPLVRYHGFLDKLTAQPEMISIMASCDLGCLLSDAEASSISILEFLRLGVPVASTVVDGMGDLIPPGAGFRVDLDAKPATIAEQWATALRAPERLDSMKYLARKWSEHVTWDRCVREWSELLQTGCVERPVRPWLGLPEDQRRQGGPK
jgi:glycosyltransferase involved in cell wall biosynthesis